MPTWNFFSEGSWRGWNAIPFIHPPKHVRWFSMSLIAFCVMLFILFRSLLSFSCLFFLLFSFFCVVPFGMCYQKWFKGYWKSEQHTLCFRHMLKRKKLFSSQYCKIPDVLVDYRSIDLTVLWFVSSFVVSIAASYSTLNLISKFDSKSVNRQRSKLRTWKVSSFQFLRKDCKKFFF